MRRSAPLITCLFLLLLSPGSVLAWALSFGQASGNRVAPGRGTFPRWQAYGIATEPADSMEDAVRKATHRALIGDVVLLSPACASFDMFQNYEHRREVFPR